MRELVEKRYVAYALLVLVLSLSPVGVAKEKPLISKIERIEKLVEDGAWDRAATEADALKHLYQKEKWKLQLLGAETEYEQLDQELEKLSAAITSRDTTEASVILSAARAVLRNIYSM